MSIRLRLGGNLSQDQRERAGIYTLLNSLPAIDMGWRWQCYCGGTKYVKYHKYFYCPGCARRVTHPDVQTINDEITFRERFVSALLC